MIATVSSAILDEYHHLLSTYNNFTLGKYPDKRSRLQSAIERAGDHENSVRDYLKTRLTDFDSYSSLDIHGQEKVVDYFTLDVLNDFRNAFTLLIEHKLNGESERKSEEKDIEAVFKFMVARRYREYVANVRAGQNIVISLDKGEVYSKMSHSGELNRIGTLNEKNRFTVDDVRYDILNTPNAFFVAAIPDHEMLPKNLITPTMCFLFPRELTLDQRNSLLDPTSLAWPEHAYEISGRTGGVVAWEDQ